MMVLEEIISDTGPISFRSRANIPAFSCEGLSSPGSFVRSIIVGGVVSLCLCVMTADPARAEIGRLSSSNLQFKVVTDDYMSDSPMLDKLLEVEDSYEDENSEEDEGDRPSESALSRAREIIRDLQYHVSVFGLEDGSISAFDGSIRIVWDRERGF